MILSLKCQKFHSTHYFNKTFYELPLESTLINKNDKNWHFSGFLNFKSSASMCKQKQNRKINLSKKSLFKS